jgi:hypothetical protein
LRDVEATAAAGAAAANKSKNISPPCSSARIKIIVERVTEGTRTRKKVREEENVSENM